MSKKKVTPDEAAVKVADDAAGRGASTVITSARGYRIRLSPVPPFLIDKTMELMPDPQAPIWHNEQTGRDEENLADPTYLREVRRVRQERADAAVNAMMLLGVELVDGVPDDGWEETLELVGIEVDPARPKMRELAYKKYIVMAQPDLDQLTAMSNVRREAVAQAEANFRGDEE